MKKSILMITLMVASSLALVGQDMNMPDKKRSQYVKQDSPERKSRAAVRGDSDKRKVASGGAYAELTMMAEGKKRKFEFDLGDPSTMKLDDRQEKMMEITQKQFEKGLSETHSLVTVLNNLHSSGWRVISTFQSGDNTTHFLLEMKR